MKKNVRVLASSDSVVFCNIPGWVIFTEPFLDFFCHWFKDPLNKTNTVFLMPQQSFFFQVFISLSLVSLGLHDAFNLLLTFSQSFSTYSEQYRITPVRIVMIIINIIIAIVVQIKQNIKISSWIMNIKKHNIIILISSLIMEYSTRVRSW